MTRLLVATLVSFVLLVGAANATGRSERIARTHCREGMVTSCIHRAAIHYHVSYGWLKSTAYCESRYNPRATNGQYMGLFQFGPNAWSRSHYSNQSPFNAKYASLGAAYLFSIGHSSEWQCA